MNVCVHDLKTYSGQLIVFEGIDGSGKSSCLNKIAEQLTVGDFNVVKLAEPSNGIFGRQIREAASSGELPPPFELTSLFIKDRIENRDSNLLPALQEGKITVLLDRYFYSNIAYQGIDLSPEYVFELNKDVILNPDLVFILDIDVDTALERIRINRNKTTGFEKREYLQKVKAIYDSFESANIRRIDARRDLSLVCEEVHAITINFLFSKEGQEIECTGKTSDSRTLGMSI